MKLHSFFGEPLPATPGSKSASGVAASSANSHFLHVGQVHISTTAQPIIMILGSSVAVCLWDPASGTGGAAHYLLPVWDGRGVASRYGNVAIGALLQKLTETGVGKEQLRAKVFGGGCRCDSPRRGDSSKQHLGGRNVQTALGILAQEHISLVSVETGADKGQRVVFHPDSGASSVTTL